MAEHGRFCIIVTKGKSGVLSPKVYTTTPEISGLMPENNSMIMQRPDVVQIKREIERAKKRN